MPDEKAVPVPVWEPEPTGVNEIADGSESPLQRVDRRVSNIQKGTAITLKMIQDHSAADETALKGINDRLTAQDEAAKTRDKKLDAHTLELHVQSRQLDTLVKVMAPRSGSTSSQLRDQIRKEIENTEVAYRRKRNLKIIGIMGAVVVAALGAAGGIAAIISALK